MTLPYQLIVGDARALPLEDASVDCIVTSPPYWRLRDYGGVVGQLGQELHHDCGGWVTGAPCGACFVCQLRIVGRECMRVLKPRGTLWLNLGDSSSNAGGGGGGSMGLERIRRGEILPTRSRTAKGLGRKNIIGLPWRVAFGFQADGWKLRMDTIWAKTRPVPEPVKDRPTRAHEYVFLFSKSRHYFYDWKSAREPVTGTAKQRGRGVHRKAELAEREGRNVKSNPSFSAAVKGLVDERNWRSWWPISSEPVKAKHFATMPTELAFRCVTAGCPIGGLVLDPFCGVGSSGVAAIRRGARFVGVDLNPTYLDCATEETDARRRIEAEIMRLGLVTPAVARLIEGPVQLGMHFAGGGVKMEVSVRRFIVSVSVAGSIVCTLLACEVAKAPAAKPLYKDEKINCDDFYYGWCRFVWCTRSNGDVIGMSPLGTCATAGPERAK